MRIKTLVSISLTTLALSCLAKGVYLVAGGDFRQSDIKYTISSTEPNMTLNVMPSGINLMRIHGNAYNTYVGPWSLKVNGTETEFPLNGCYGISNPGLCSNVSPVMVTFPTIGNHLVKIYDQKHNINELSFNYATNITSIYVDQDVGVPDGLGSWILKVSINNCPDLKKIYWGNPQGKTEFNGFTGLIALQDFRMKTPERITKIINYTFSQCDMTNDFYYLNVTNIGNNVCGKASNISQVILPNIETIGSEFLNLFGVTVNEDLGNGLKKLVIGDTIKSIGSVSFANHKNLKVIEFIVDDSNSDWIATWNEKTCIKQFFGEATLVEGSSTEATLSPLPWEQVSDLFWSNKNLRPTPTTLRRRNRSEFGE